MATATPDQKFLVLYGNSIMLSVVGLLVGGMLYGVYVILFCVAVVILCRREGNSKARIGLLLATLVMFGLSSFWFWSSTDIFMASIKQVFVDDVGPPLVAKHTAYFQKFQKLGSVALVIVPLEIILGDAILLWRTWVLCGVNRKIVYIPLVLLIGTTACSLGFLGCFAQHDWPVVNPDTCNSLEISAFTLSMATNIAGTLCIGYRLWCYRQAVGKYLGECRYQTRIEKVLVVLLESGVIYSILWIVQLVLVLMPPPPTFAGKIVQQIVSAACIQLVGIYPTLLIVLIYFQCSLWDSPEISGSTESSTSESPTVPCSSVDFKSNSTLIGKV